MSTAEKLPLHHIAMFLPSLVGGGAERVFLTLAGSFAQAGISVDLVLAGAYGELMAQVGERINVIDLGKKRVLLSLPGLFTYIHKHKPQILLTALPHANLLGIWAVKLARSQTRVIVSEHGLPLSMQQFSSDVKERVVSALIKVCYPHAHAIVSVSDSSARQLESMLGRCKINIKVIGNPIEMRRVEIQAQMPVEHSWLKDKDCPVIVAAGRLHPHKDFPTLLRSLAVLNHTRKVKLILLGEGEQRAHLQALAATLGLESLVDMPGFITNPLPYYCQADVFVLSSLLESCPMVLLEALACGTQVVSTNCGGPDEILVNGKFGGLVPPGDPQALAESISYRLDHPIPAYELRRRAMDFDLPRVTTRYLDLIAHVLSGGGSD